MRINLHFEQCNINTTKVRADVYFLSDDCTQANLILTRSHGSFYADSNLVHGLPWWNTEMDYQNGELMDYPYGLPKNEKFRKKSFSFSYNLKEY